MNRKRLKSTTREQSGARIRLKGKHLKEIVLKSLIAIVGAMLFVALLATHTVSAPI